MIRMRHRIAGFAVAALAVAAIAAPAASARPIDSVGYHPQPAATSSNPAPAEVRVVEQQSGSGFDWGDAGIGAAAMFGVTMTGLGGLAVSSHRHRPAPRSSS